MKRRRPAARCAPALLKVLNEKGGWVLECPSLGMAEERRMGKLEKTLVSPPSLAPF